MWDDFPTRVQGRMLGVCLRRPLGCILHALLLRGGLFQIGKFSFQNPPLHANPQMRIARLGSAQRKHLEDGIHRDKSLS